MKQKLKAMHYLGTLPGFRIVHKGGNLFYLQEFGSFGWDSGGSYNMWATVYEIDIETGEDKHTNYWEKVRTA